MMFLVVSLGTLGFCKYTGVMRVLLILRVYKRLLPV